MNVDRLPETSTKRMKKPNTIPQKRALSIIWPGISYETALDKTALSTLSDRRAVRSCIQFIGKEKRNFSAKCG